METRRTLGINDDEFGLGTDMAGEERISASDIREKVTAAEAASRLGVSSKRVFQLLKDPRSPLNGPGPVGRGRGRRRLVFTDSIEAEADRMRQRTSRTGDTTLSRSEDVRWALRELNAATEALHRAAAKEAEARKLQLDVIENLTRALELQQEATQDVRKADQLRSLVLGTLLSPDDPRGL